MMMPIRVLIIDDSAVMCRLLTDVLAGDPLLQVAGTASNGVTGLGKIKELRPDLVILDIQMPIMDGLETLKILRTHHPKLPVIMFSSLTGRGSAATIEALSLGASDYVSKPAIGVPPSEVIERIGRELIPKIRSLVPGGRVLTPEPSASLLTQVPHLRRRVDVIAIGASTGGPNALNELLPHLPEHLPVPVLIVQHMPALFTHMLAERLHMLSQLSIHEAKDDDLLRPGHVYIAPGGYHMLIASGKQGPSISLNQNPPENSCRPSVDVLFRSVADAYAANALGLILTGMGSDGTAGARAIRDAGGELWAQDRDTSVVWGMPGSVVAAGCANRVCPLPQIAAEIVSRLAVGRTPVHVSTARANSAAEARS